MGILNIGVQALNANSAALQTSGNNVANVNTPGYSRQRVALTNQPGQFIGAGFIGKGVAIETIQRQYDMFLDRQATITSSAQAADQLRSDKLTLLGDLFQGGTNGVGAAVSDMLNAFADVTAAPTDLTARTVALTRVDETASRLRNLSAQLDDLQAGVDQPLGEMVGKINTIATKIASINDQITRAKGSGHSPNDLLDQRDQLIRDLNQYVQTTTIPADDGSYGIFIGGSQALVLGTQTATVSLGSDTFGDQNVSKLVVDRSGAQVTLEESAIGGGQLAGLLRFKNSDMVEARNLLGRLTYSITSAMNEQHQLGLDLDGNVGGNLFTPIDINTTRNVLPHQNNTGGGALSISVVDRTKLAASNYQVDFTAAGGIITRVSDGQTTAFGALPITVDGLNFDLGTAGGAVGDRFLIKPFVNSASNIAAQFTSPRALAVASPVAVAATNTNKGSLTVGSLKALNSATTFAPTQYTITFTVAPGSITYDISDGASSVGSGNFVPGQTIGPDPTIIAPPAPSWSLTLTGAPVNGDTLVVQANPYPNLSGGNAKAIMDLRDQAMFDGSALTDGYASAIAQLGIRAQSALYSAEVSTNLAQNAESARANISGVNLDEEGAKLLQFQQAYQASAKLIQIAQSIFDNLIQTMTR